MKVHLVNPSDLSFGRAVITPRWLFVLAAATPKSVGDPILTDECLEPIVPEAIEAGDLVGISIHTDTGKIFGPLIIAALQFYAVITLSRSAHS